ncbi:hypothetical protein C8R46DRAFT_970636 [Mycena filopes]|nr:hypothetical protein C8R46DRAFT_970636 [Mycena filopes]
MPKSAPAKITRSPGKSPAKTHRKTPLDTLKAKFVQQNRLWLWDAANKAVILDAQTYFDSSAARYTPSETLAALRAFATSLEGSGDYPARPAFPPSSSASYNKLRDILERAASTADEETCDEVEEVEDPFSEEMSVHWKAPYMTDLFGALIAVIGEHGIKGVGWESARWEVYDTHTRCLGGLQFYGRDKSRFNDAKDDKRWFDDAKDWLDGQVMLCEAGVLMSRQDNQSDLGRRYNALLPVIRPGYSMWPR